MAVREPQEPRELGEFFRFIAEVTDVFPDETIQDTSNPLNLVTCGTKFGIIFISNRSIIKVFYTKELIDEASTIPLQIINVRGPVTHISLSCDGRTLFVVSLCDGPFAFFYDVCHLLKKDQDPVPFYSVPLSSQVGAYVLSLSWNPCDPNCIAVALSTGDLCLLKIKDSSVEFLNKKELEASAVTWSAKGKQLAVGKKDGTMTLFKPDLTMVRSVEAPGSQDIGGVIDITWFTNTEFFVGYVTADNLPVLFYVNAPKGKPASYFNFEDICYSSNSAHPVSYYTVYISEWNLLFVFSSNGIEMGLIGKTQAEEGECKWCQWFPDDGVRAMMHFFDIKHETFPLGLAVDFTSQKVFPSKDETASGPFPVLVTLSTKGQLNLFFVDNKMGNSPKLCASIEALPSTGYRTPEQFGQLSTIKPQTYSAPAEPTLSPLPAFSLKKSEGPPPISTTLFSSTPIKTVSSDPEPTTSTAPFGVSSSTFSSAPLINTSQDLSSSFSFVPADTKSSNIFSFSSSLVSQPASLSREIGTSTTLPVPSPQPSVVVSSAAPSAPLPTRAPSSAPSEELKERQLALLENGFAAELAQLVSANGGVQYQVGSAEEDTEVKLSLEEIRQWMEAMMTTTEEQSDEVGLLHKKTLEASAAYEDTNTHKEIKFSSRNRISLQLRPLDSYSQRKLDYARSRYQYLMGQIGDVNAKLDSMWEDFASRKQPYSRLSQRSMSENLYRSVLNLHNMRAGAEQELDSITRKLKKLTIHPVIPSIDLDSSYFRTLGRPGFLPHSPQPQLSPRKTKLRQVLAQRSTTPLRIATSSLNLNNEYDLADSSKDGSSLQVGGASFGQRVDESVLGSPQLPKAEYKNVSPPKVTLGVSSSSSLAALYSLVDKVPGVECSDDTDHNLPSVSVVKTELSGPSESTRIFSFTSNQSVKEPITCKTSDVTAKTSPPTLFGVPQFSFSNKSSMAPSSTPFSFSLSFNTSGQNVPSLASSTTTIPAIDIQGSVPMFAFPSSTLASASVGMSSGSKSVDSASSSTAGNASSGLFVTSIASSTSTVSTLFSPVVSFMANRTQGNFLVPSLDSKTSVEEKSISSGSEATSSSSFATDIATTSAPPLKLEGSFSTLTQSNISSVISPRGTATIVPSSSSIQVPPETTTSLISVASTSQSSGGLFGNLTSSTTSVTFSASSVSFKFQQDKSSSPSTSTSKSASPSVSTSLTSSLQPTSSPSGLRVPVTNVSSEVASLPSIASSGQQVSASASILKQHVSGSSSFGSPTLFAQASTTPSLLGQWAVNSATLSSSASTTLFALPSGTTVTPIKAAPAPSSGTTSYMSTTQPTNTTLAISSLSQAKASESAATIIATSAQTPLFASLSVSSASVASNTTPFFCAQTTTSSFFSSVITSSTLPSSSTSAFGQVPPSSSSLLGNPPGTGSVFGQASASAQTTPASSSVPLFGELSGNSVFRNASSSTSLFGVPSSTTSQTLFGGVQSPVSNTTPDMKPSSFSIASPGSSLVVASTAAGSIFGNSASASIFGQASAGAATTNASSTGSFGSSPFGGFGPSSAAPPAGSSVFGNAGGNQPSGTSIFGNAAVAPSSQSSSGGSIFGGAPVTSQSIFGGSSSSTSSFGFGAGNNNSPFSGGSLFSGLGKAPSAEDANKNVFGGKSVSQQSTNLFGSSGGSGFGGAGSTLFGGASPATTGGAFSPVKTEGSVFGSAPTFGSSPTFDNKSKTPFGGSVFGGSAAFGSTPSFGAGSVFGGSNPAYSSPPSSGGFGKFASTSNTTFGSIASQSGSSGFGQFSQQSGDSNNIGNAPLGGSSFTSWREN